MKIRIDPHTLERAQERGTDAEEIKRWQCAGKQRYGLCCEPALFTRVLDETAEKPGCIQLAARFVGGAYRRLQEESS